MFAYMLNGVLLLQNRKYRQRHDINFILLQYLDDIIQFQGNLLVVEVVVKRFQFSVDLF